MNDQEKINQELTDEQLDSAIATVLESPEVSAMLENAAADAASDVRDILSPSFSNVSITGSLSSEVADAAIMYDLSKRLDALEARIEKAFKHAGFKF